MLSSDQHSKMVNILAAKPSSLGFNSKRFKKFSSGKIVDVAEENQWRKLQESRQWLKYVDRTYLVLVSGKIVLQKRNAWQ